MSKNQVINTEKDLTVEQAAEYFQVTRKTIYERMNDGSLESYCFGRSRRIKIESIEQVRNGRA